MRRQDLPWLIPVRFDDCDIPDLEIGAGRTLSWIQRADLFGEYSDLATSRLAETIRQILAREESGSTIAPSGPPPRAGHQTGQVVYQDSVIFNNVSIAADTFVARDHHA